MKIGIVVKTSISTLVATMLITACGGGGSPSVPVASGSESGSTTTTPPPATPVAADLIVSVEKSVLTNSGVDQAALNIIAVDAARNVLAAVPIAVTVDSGATFAPTTTSTLTASGAATATATATATASVTGADGNYTGKITIGSDKSNRLISYKVISGSIVKTGVISVRGIALEVVTNPSKPQPAEPVALRVVVKDSAGNGVSGTKVSISGLPNVTIASQDTDAAGLVTFSLIAPAVGIYPVAVESAGVKSSFALQVQTSTAGVVPAAVGPVSGASTIATPVVVAANSTGLVSNQSEIRALFYSFNNVPIRDMRVRFFIKSTPLPGEFLSTGSNVVYSDVTGASRSSYIASTASSPTNGVLIRACYDLNDFPVGACPNFIDTTLTVTSSPVSLTIGSDNVISKNTSGIQYIKQFQIQAVDSAGNAKADVPLSAVVDIDGYWKGATPPAPPTSSTEDIFSGSSPALTHKWCLNEDKNRNNVLDVGEDNNRDGSLTPRKSDAAISFVNGTVKTDASGLALMQLSYPQNLATWLRVKIKVTAGVAGSEGEATYTYVLRYAEEDAANGSFKIPPYGSNLGQPSPAIDRDGEGCKTPN